MATGKSECIDNKHREAMMSSFLKMVTSHEFSDVVLQVQGHKFSCHKVILAATCPYFKGMFSNPFSENESNEVTIKGVEASTMVYIVGYIYSGKVSIDTNNAQDLISAADMFQLDNLKEHCSSFLQEQIRTYNCLGFWNLARQLHIPELEKKAWNCMTLNFPRVIEGEEMLEMEVNDLCHLLSSPALKITGEEIVCKCALAWLQHKPERKQHLRTVLVNVHLDDLKPSFIKTTLMTHSLIKNDSYCMKLFQGVMDYLTMNMPCPNEVSLLPLRCNTNTDTGILLLGGKVGQPMNRVHTFAMVNIDFSSTDETSHNAAKIEHMGNLPTIHKYSAACGQGNTVYLAGMGNDLQEVWKYDSAGRWAKCSPLRYARTGLTLTSGFTDTLYAVGGAEGYLGTGVCENVSWIEEYNIPENTWTVVGELQNPVCYHTAVFYMGKMFIMGGFLRDTKACDKIQMFDTQTHVSVKLEMRLPKPMAYGKGLVVREHVILVEQNFTLVFSGSDLLKEVNQNYERNNSVSEEEDQTKETEDQVAGGKTDDESEARSDEKDESSSSQAPLPATEEILAQSPIITHSADSSDIVDVRPSTSGLNLGRSESQDSEVVTSPVDTFYPYCSSYMVKQGCGVELVTAECLGDQLVVFGGRKSERNAENVRILSKAIRACSLKDCLSVGNDVNWRVIGRLEQPMVVFMSAKFKVNKRL